MMDPRTLPARAMERAAEFAESGAAPAAVRDSAAVLLLRPGRTGKAEVCTMVRHHAMATSGGVPVFPGGLVDAQDSIATVLWVSGDVTRWACDLGTDEDAARAVVTAAVRELFEEVGVLLAGPSATEVAVPPVDGWADERRRLEAHELTFEEFLRSHGWGVRADLVHLWSTWTTPEFEARRYRNRFFIAGLPQGQEVAGGSTESQVLRWSSFGELIDGATAGTIQLLPPQCCLSLELRDFDGIEDIVSHVAASPDRESVLPTLEEGESGPRLVLPAHFLELAASV